MNDRKKNGALIRLSSAAAVGALLIPLLTSSATASQQFSVTMLQGSIGGMSIAPGGFDPVSANGFVVGRTDNFQSPKAVRWNVDGTAVLLQDPSGPVTINSRATGVDSAGNVVGNASLSGVGDVGVRWNANGVINTTAPYLGALSDSGFALSWSPGNGPMRLNPNGSTTALSPTNSTAYALSESGRVVGTRSGSSERAYRWDIDGTANELNAFVGGTLLRHTRAWGVNNSATVVGNAELLNNPELRAVRWNAAGVASFLTMPFGIQNSGGQALGIDDDGRILGAGAVAPAQGTGRRVIFWDASGTPRLIQNMLTESGWSIESDWGFASNAYSTSILVSGRHPTLTNNAYRYLLLQQVLTSTVSAGTNARAASGGGAVVTGGASAVFASATGGTFVATFDPDATAAQFPLLPAGITLGSSGQTQAWEVNLTGGTFSGPVTLTFGYDPTNLPTGNLADLRILHLLDSGEWETLVPTFGANNTLGVTVTELSPFLITAIPEPTTLSIIGVSAIGLLARRRRRENVG